MRVRLPPGVPLMTKWQDYFKIVDVDREEHDMFYTFEYQLVVIANDKIVGTYKDEAYAKKQAKYKFRRMLKQVEKTLLG